MENICIIDLTTPMNKSNNILQRFTIAMNFEIEIIFGLNICLGITILCQWPSQTLKFMLY